MRQKEKYYLAVVHMSLTRRIFFLALAVALFPSCGDESPASPSSDIDAQESESECDEGFKGCDGTWTSICAEGILVRVRDCAPTGQVCMEGVCQDPSQDGDIDDDPDPDGDCDVACEIDDGCCGACRGEIGSFCVENGGGADYLCVCTDGCNSQLVACSDWCAERGQISIGCAEDACVCGEPPDIDEDEQTDSDPETDDFEEELEEQEPDDAESDGPDLEGQEELEDQDGEPDSPDNIDPEETDSETEEESEESCDEGPCCQDGSWIEAGQPCLSGADPYECTIDLCTAERECGHYLYPDYCLIDGECYTRNQRNEANRCEKCDPILDEAGWSVVVCDDGDACTTDACIPSSGACSNLAEPCADDDACTLDACDPVTGLCGHSPIECHDENPCTIDSCDPVGGCQYPYNDCSDGNLCTNDICDPATGECGHSPACDDGVPCTVDSCDPDLGCSWDAGACVCLTPDDCTDDDPCTDDICDLIGQTCSHETTDCGDDVDCTSDSCDPVEGCLNEVNDDEFEDNDTPETAEPLPTDGTWHDLIAAEGDDDFFVLNVCEGGILQITIAFDRGMGDIELALFDADGFPLGTGTSIPEGAMATWSASFSGQVQARIRGSQTQVCFVYALQASLDDSGC